MGEWMGECRCFWKVNTLPVVDFERVTKLCGFFLTDNWTSYWCLGEHAAPEDSIHMVPFQFDLIQLLPNCQQVELFFFTFSAGTVHLKTFQTNESCNTCSKRCCLWFPVFFSCRERGSGSQFSQSAQRALAQPLPQQPWAGTERQRGPVRW